MRIYSSQYTLIAGDIIRALTRKELVEIEETQVSEAELDVIGVLREYNRITREINDQSRDQTADRAEAMRLRRRLAKEKGVGFGEEGLVYVIEQIIETLMVSPNIEEIFGTDRELRAVITPILDSHTRERDREDELDVLVRGRIKNLEEGTSAWDIEYQRVQSQLRRTRGMSTDE